MRRCVYRKQFDLETLVCTRGPNFPLSRLKSRLMCPRANLLDVLGGGGRWTTANQPDRQHTVRRSDVVLVGASLRVFADK